MRYLSSLVLASLCLSAPASAQLVKLIPEMPKPPVPIAVGVGAGAGGVTLAPRLGGVTLTPGAPAPRVAPAPAPVAAVPVMIVPPAAGARAVQVMACPSSSTDDYSRPNCGARLVDATAVLARLQPCTDGRCYASRIAELTRAPQLIIAYPAEPARAAELQRAIRKEIAYAAEYMGEELTRRARDGDAGLPSVEAIDELVASARREVDAIDQPIDENPDQRRQRLGLGPAKRRMAALLGA